MFREQGNALFRSGAFEEALLLYGAALAEDAEKPDTPAVRATLLGNRSACNLSLKRYDDARRDAREALALDPFGEKNHFRLIMALRGLGMVDEATSVLQQALVQFPGATAFAKLQQQQQQQQQHAKKKPIPRAQQEPEIVGAMLIETAPAEGCSSEEIAMRSETRRLIRRLQQQSSSSREQLEHQLSGTFKQLSTRQSLVDVLFPGVPAPQLAQLPQSLREVLLWRELMLDVSKIAKSAWAVFAEVRRKAALAGDAMDRDAQTIMSAQVVQEALAREVVASVRRLAKQMSQVSARVSLSLASPGSEKAQQDQLLAPMVEQLLAEDISCQDEYLGGDWAALIASDIVRFVAHERMTPVGEVQGEGIQVSVPPCLPSMAYVDLDAGLLEESYPALAEAVGQLHALPHELNLKSGGRLRLLEAAKGCTMIHHFPVGAQQPLRLDISEKASSDSGIRLTCSYHLCVSPENGTARVVDLSHTTSTSTSPAKFGHCPASYSDNQPFLAGEMQYLDIHNDWLVLHQSTRVRNERQPAANEYFVITFLVHQQPLETEEEEEA